MGVVAVVLGTENHPDEEVIVLGSRNGEKGGDWWSAVGGLLKTPCDGLVGVLEGLEYR